MATSAKDTVEPQSPLSAAAPATDGILDLPAPSGSLMTSARNIIAGIVGAQPWPGRPPSFWDRADVRLGLSIVFVLGAIAATAVLSNSTGQLVSFPFYVAVVASAWLGLGPGILSFFLSSLAAADFWTRHASTWTSRRPTCRPSWRSCFSR